MSGESRLVIRITSFGACREVVGDDGFFSSRGDMAVLFLQCDAGVFSSDVVLVEMKGLGDGATDPLAQGLVVVWLGWIRADP